MAAEVLWSPKAEADLEDLYAFIAFENVEAADKLIDRIQAAADLLSNHPRLGRRRPEIAPAFRMVNEGPYLILYGHSPTATQVRSAP